MSNCISRIIVFIRSLLMTSLTFKHGDFSQMSFPASQWGRHQIRDREFGWYILRYIFKSSSWFCSVGQHFPSDDIFLLKNIMNWKKNKKDMAKEIIVTLSSAWPRVQGKVPSLSCHSTPSSLPPPSALLSLVIPLSSAFLANRRDSAFLPRSDTLSAVTQASCGVLGF